MLNKMLISDWISLITALGVIVAIIASIAGIAKAGRKEASADTQAITEMRSDIKHILEKVERLENTPERLTGVEESIRQAHKRLDGHDARIQKMEERK